jgi:hypothetical protein
VEPHSRRYPRPYHRHSAGSADLSPRELAVKFTDTESYFVSEASVYRLLKAHDLITSPAFIVIKAGDEFKDKTTRAEPAVADRLHLSCASSRMVRGAYDWNAWRKEEWKIALSPAARGHEPKRR